MKKVKAKNFTRGDGLLEAFLAKKRAKKANSLIPLKKRSGRILDIGCGTYPYFLVDTEFKEKYGLDKAVNKSGIEDKAIKINKLSFEHNKLPFDNSFFDAVTMLAVFEHVNKDKIDFVLSEINRVLKKDGVFIITTPSPWADKVLHFMARTGFISKVEIHDHKHNFFPSSVGKFLVEAGFKKSKIKNGFFEGSFNMWFVIRK